FFMSLRKQSKDLFQPLPCFFGLFHDQTGSMRSHWSYPQYTAWLMALQMPACTGATSQLEKQLSTSELVSS
ncbi:MAG: hypothetical protein ACRDIV_26390, partial [Ktedonobacteraceae bacterium]